MVITATFPVLFVYVARLEFFLFVARLEIKEIFVNLPALCEQMAGANVEVCDVIPSSLLVFSAPATE